MYYTFLAFLLANVSMISSKLIESTSSVSMENIDKAQSFSCLRPDRNIFLTLDNVENDRSPSQFVTGRVRNILSAIIHVRKCCCQSKFPNNFKFWGVISSFFTNISKCVSSDFIVSSMSTGYSLMSLFAFSSSSFCTFLEMKLCRGF